MRTTAGKGIFEADIESRVREGRKRLTVLSCHIFRPAVIIAHRVFDL